MDSNYSIDQRECEFAAAGGREEVQRWIRIIQSTSANVNSRLRVGAEICSDGFELLGQAARM